MVDNLAHVDAALAARVAAPLGINAPDAQAATQWPGFRHAAHPVDVVASPALSMAPTGPGSVATRQVAILVCNGVDAAAVAAVQQALAAAGASSKIIAAALGTVEVAEGGLLAVDCTLVTTPSVVFDAVYLPCLGVHAAALVADGDAVHFVLEAYKHCKPIAASGSGAGLLASVGLSMPTAPGVTQPQPGVVLAGAGKLPARFAPAFIQAIAIHRHWDRSGLATVPA